MAISYNPANCVISVSGVVADRHEAPSVGCPDMFLYYVAFYVNARSNKYLSPSLGGSGPGAARRARRRAIRRATRHISGDSLRRALDTLGVARPCAPQHRLRPCAQTGVRADPARPRRTAARQLHHRPADTLLQVVGARVGRARRGHLSELRSALPASRRALALCCRTEKRRLVASRDVLPTRPPTSYRPSARERRVGLEPEPRERLARVPPSERRSSVPRSWSRTSARTIEAGAGVRLRLDPVTVVGDREHGVAAPPQLPAPRARSAAAPQRRARVRSPASPRSTRGAARR